MLLHVTSPHQKSLNSTPRVMAVLVLTLVPALLVHINYFGYGLLTNLIFCIFFALLFETLALLLRRRNALVALRDNSALVTAVLLAFAIPPFAPLWLIIIGCGVAIILGKQLYGGLGQNCFNPAMIGYAVLLISFPLQMSQWPLPIAISQTNIDWSFAWQIVGGNASLPDGVTAATALDIYRNNSGLSETEVIASQPILFRADYITYGIEWFNIAIAIGGLIMIALRICHWQAPLGMLVALALCAMLFYDSDSVSSRGSITFHLLSGATMLGAFYIVTDPVSGPTSNSARFIAGAMVGILTYLIRIFGNYPDGVAFAILLMNFSAPFLDRFTKPRVYGN